MVLMRFMKYLVNSVLLSDEGLSGACPDITVYLHRISLRINNSHSYGPSVPFREAQLLALIECSSAFLSANANDRVFPQVKAVVA